MRKVFRYFLKNKYVKNKISVPIVIGVIAVAVAVILISYEQGGTMEVEDTFDKELLPDENSPEIQKKIDEIEEIKLENQYTPTEREWITSGPFQIDRSEYIIGEKIFVRIGGLGFEEKGQIAFLRPLNETHYSVYQTIPFDGTKKPEFNYYLQPQLSKVKGYCTIDDFVGEWKVIFRGTNYPNLEFNITDDILPGEESRYMPVC